MSEAYAVSSSETVKNLQDAAAITTEKRMVAKGPDLTRPSARHSARDWLSNQMIIERLSDAIFEDGASRSLEETNDMPVNDAKRRKSVISAGVRRSLKSENELDEESEDKQEDPYPSVSLGAQPSAKDNDEAVAFQAGSAVTDTGSFISELEPLHDTEETFPTPDLETVTLNGTISTESIVIRSGTATPSDVEAGPEPIATDSKGSPRANPPSASPKPPAPSFSRRAPLPINVVGERPSHSRAPSNHQKRAKRRATRRAKRIAKKRAKRIVKLVPLP